MRCRKFLLFTPCSLFRRLRLHPERAPTSVGKVNAPSNRILTGGGPLRSAARWRFSSSSMRSEMRFASSSAASRSWRSASLFACAASKFKDPAGRNRESKGQKQARGRKRGGGRGTHVSFGGGAMARVSGSSLPVSSYTTMPTLPAPLPMPALRPGLLLAVRGRPLLPLLLAPPPFTPAPAPAPAPADGPAPFAPRFGRDSIAVVRCCVRDVVQTSLRGSVKR